MKKESNRIAVVCVILSVMALLTAVFPFAADSGARNSLASTSASDVSFINTQYTYTSYRESWLRNLIVKEDILSPSGVVTRDTLVPVTDYPYTQTAASFSKDVASYVTLYTLDDDSEKAAYLYLFKQLDALTIISEPGVTDDNKIAYLENEGIVMPDNVRDDQTNMLMVRALYSFMRNDFYYVVTGEPEIEIPRGTGLEEALMLYTMAVSGQSKVLPQFVSKYFGGSITTFDDYVYYTTLYALWINGYVKTNEIGKISREEVYRRMAIYQIQQFGITIDASTATDEEIKLKYMAAGLGDQYAVNIDWLKLKEHLSADTVPFYLLQLMGNKDAGLTISNTYGYDRAFTKVCKSTDRFELDEMFYSDICEYNVKLSYQRDEVSFRAIPLFQSSAENGTEVKITLADGTSVTPDSYVTLSLSDKAKQTITMIVRYFQNGVQKNATTYKLYIFQGGDDAPETNALTNPIQTWSAPADTNAPGAITVPSFTADPNQVVTVNGSVVSLGSDILNQMYSTDANGNYIDANGNVIASFNYETLPPGYEYTVYDDGNVGVVQIGNTDVTEPFGTGGDGLFGKIASFAARWMFWLIGGGVLAVLIALGVTLFFVLKKRKKRSHQ